ncbi:MAG: aromatic ring-hydroxylating oxygenase subunit alpha, partial [Solirubrobacteraceae bacterium]
MVSQTDVKGPVKCGAPDSALAPLDPGELARSLRAFGESRMLPRAAYTDPAVFEWEQRHFFEDGWTCAGDASMVAASGDRRAVPAGHGSVLLVRGIDGAARAFANVCRHRGHELAPCEAETVNQSVIVCPYHAWSYRLDGHLRKAPGFDEAHG